MGNPAGKEESGAQQGQLMVLVTYSLTHMNHCEKIKFFYSLNGRAAKQGLLEQLDAEKLAKGVLLVSHKDYATLQEFLNGWECSYQTRYITLQNTAVEHVPVQEVVSS